MLTKRLKKSSEDGSIDKPLDVDSLTKGQAANVITRLKHGAKVKKTMHRTSEDDLIPNQRILQGRYAKKMKQKFSLELKEARQTEKEKLRKAREHVAVGPLHTEETHYDVSQL